jgi:pimeloyl-ACP methyl ester carboxylesterase
MTNALPEEIGQLYPDLPLTVRKVGDGRPIFVVHGGHGPVNTTEIANHFAPDSTVIVPTHPGWDGTPRPEWFSGIDDLAVTYLDLLEDLDLRDVVLIGLSFGGWIASEMAVRDRGQRIGRLVIIGALGPSIVGHELKGPTDGGTLSPEIKEVVRVYGGERMHDPKLLRRIARVQAPTLVIWGEHDTFHTAEFGREYANAFPNSRFVVIPDAGHMPHRERPEATLAAIDDFLAK